MQVAWGASLGRGSNPREPQTIQALHFSTRVPGRSSFRIPSTWYIATAGIRISIVLPSTRWAAQSFRGRAHGILHTLRAASLSRTAAGAATLATKALRFGGRNGFSLLLDLSFAFFPKNSIAGRENNCSGEDRIVPGYHTAPPERARSPSWCLALVKERAARCKGRGDGGNLLAVLCEMRPDE